MSSLIENRASLKKGPPIHFRDSSWKKNASWKLYKGYCRDEEHGNMKTVVIMVPVHNIWTEEDCDREIKKYEQIKELATEFNSNIKMKVPRKAIIDRTAGVHGMKFRSRTLSRDEWVLVFDYMGKKLRTFVKRNGTSTRCSALDAFVHFTYKQSGGTSVVSKLIGLECKSGYILSRPSLITDARDVKTVMKNHVCNSLCQGFPKPQDLPQASEGILLSVQPSAPPAEDPESDEDVFSDNGPSKEDLIQFSVEMDNAQQLHAIRYHLYPVPNHARMTNYGISGLPGQCNDLPPAYTSYCPPGHRAVSCGSPDGNGNISQTQPWCFNDILLMGDTAPVQQASLMNGLS